MKRAIAWSAVWIGLGLTLAMAIFIWDGQDRALDYLAGYLIEEALSADNLLVFAMIFTSFGVPQRLQRTVLFWGILGAIVTRGIMILGGTALINRFEWMLYLFGGLLVLVGVRLSGDTNRTVQPERNPIVRAFKRLVPTTDGFRDDHFVVREHGRLKATPLLVVLLAVESTDLVFAIDSIPAIFAITRDPFIVYTSNVMAVLGLRSLFFVLAGAGTRFKYLQPALAVLLVFAGAKMLTHELMPIPTTVSLVVIVGTLAIAIVASVILGNQREVRNAPWRLTIRDRDYGERPR